MKECKFCGMPMQKGIEEEVCDFCKNDDGADFLLNSDDDEEEDV